MVVALCHGRCAKAMKTRNRHSVGQMLFSGARCRFGCLDCQQVATMTIDAGSNEVVVEEVLDDVLMARWHVVREIYRVRTTYLAYLKECSAMP